MARNKSILTEARQIERAVTLIHLGARLPAKDERAECYREAVVDNRMEGDAMDLLSFLVVGLVAGWLAGVLVKGGGFGAIGDIIVGVVGALLGGFLFRSLGVSAGGGLVGNIVVATVGAVVLLFIVRLVKRA